MHSTSTDFTHAHASSPRGHSRTAPRPRVLVTATALALGVTLAAPTAALADDLTPILDAPVDDYGGQAPDVCDGVYPGVIAAQDILESNFGNQSQAAGRACTGGWMSNHSKGLALDWFVNSYSAEGRAEAQQILNWLFEPSSDGSAGHVRLRRLGINEIIWDRRIWSIDQRGATSDIGTWDRYRGCTTGSDCAHERHIHFSFSMAGGTMQTSWWNDDLAPYRDSPATDAVTVPQPSFEPAENMTYGEYATWLYRLAGAPVVPGQDDAVGTARAIAWLDAVGIEGFGDDVAVDAVVLRDQYARILFAFDELDGLRRGGVREHDTVTFADVEAVHPHYEEIMWVGRNGIGAYYRTAEAEEEATDAVADSEGAKPEMFFDPKEPMSRQDAALFLHRFAGESEVEALDRDPYADVPEDPYRDAVLWMWDGQVDRDAFGDVTLEHDLFDEIQWMVREGLAAGDQGDAFTNPTFGSTDPVSRQEFAAMLHGFDLLEQAESEAAQSESAQSESAGSASEGSSPMLGDGSAEPGATESSETPGFADVPADHPFSAEIAWLEAEGINGIEDGADFRPGERVSRAEVAAMLQRYAGVEPAPVLSATFADVPADHPFHNPIEWIASEGLESADAGDEFRPEDLVTREEMAGFLYRLAQKSAYPEVGAPLFPRW